MSSSHLNPLALGLLLALGTASPTRAQRPEDQAPAPSAPIVAEFKFSFAPAGAQPAPAGFTSVSADTPYTTERGHGFDLGTKPGTDAPLFFSVKVPEGN